MRTVFDNLRWECKARDYLVIDADPDGIGIEFRDSHDVWWLLPGDPLSSVAVPSAGSLDFRAILGEFERRDHLRSRAIHAIRHHLAGRGVESLRSRDGRWIVRKGCMTSEIHVGASLTAMFDGTDDVVAAVRNVFQASMIARVPAERRVRRYLATVGDPVNEHAWSEEEPSPNLLHVLQMMGVCRLIDSLAGTAESGRVCGVEEMVEAVGGGRIARALMRFGAAIPNVPASLELTDRSVSVRFADGLDDYKIAPKSRDLVERVRRDGSDRAGDALLVEFRRLEADRFRVIATLREALPRLGFRVQDENATLHFGRETREASVNLGAPLTAALRQGSAREAIRELLSSHPLLAEAVADALPGHVPEKLPEPSNVPLRPPEPPLVALPQVPELDLARLDREAREVIDRYLVEREVLDAYDDPPAP